MLKEIFMEYLFISFCIYSFHVDGMNALSQCLTLLLILKLGSHERKKRSFQNLEHPRGMKDTGSRVQWDFEQVIRCDSESEGPYA